MIKKIIEILKVIMSALAKIQPPDVHPLPAPTQEKKPEPVQEKKPEPKAEPVIDWSNPKCKISKYFTVEDATALRSWGVLHIPSESEKANILKVANKMDIIREFINEPIIISAWMRPAKANCPNSKWNGQDYNRYIYETQVWRKLSAEEKAKKTVPNSPHREGNAVDWIVAGKGTVAYCDVIRNKLLPKLEEWSIRMEDMQGKGNWIHIDTRLVINKRFFKP